MIISGIYGYCTMLLHFLYPSYNGDSKCGLYSLTDNRALTISSDNNEDIIPFGLHYLYFICLCSVHTNKVIGCLLKVYFYATYCPAILQVPSISSFHNYAFSPHPSVSPNCHYSSIIIFLQT